MSMIDIDSGQISNLLARLTALPERIAGTVMSWNVEQLRASLAIGTWSARDILAHLRAVDSIVASPAYVLLTCDNPSLLAFDERRWAGIARYAETDFHASLTLFTLRQAELAAAFRAIAPADWQRSGTHEEYGPISLLDVVRDFVEHAEERCAQLKSLAQTLHY